MQQSFSLRGHSASVSALHSVSSGEPVLVSADAEGWVICWNLGLKRPVFKWRAHQGKIITVKFLKNNRLITQSRDSSIKIWQMPRESADVPSLMIEVPINSLNFCNIIYEEPILITPASTDSNNFDVYKLDSSDEKSYNLSRLLANYNVYDLYQRKASVIDIPSDPELARSGFGIIMNMTYIPEKNHLFLGYESGHVIGLHIDFQSSVSSTTSNERTVINKDPRIALIYSDSTHSPNPVLSLAYAGDQIISGSTNKKIVIHDYVSQLQQSRKLSSAGIQSICPHNGGLVIGFWSGLIEVISLESDVPSFQHKRDVPQINLTESNKTSVNDTPSDSKNSATRPTCSQSINFSHKLGSKSSYKDLIRAKRLNRSESLLMVGYEDGTIIAFA